jgi:hypothetical protein
LFLESFVAVMAWMAKISVVSALLLASFVTGNPVKVATFPPAPCTDGTVTTTGPQGVCSYITDDKLGKIGAVTLVNKRKCCDAHVTIDVTTCSTACQRSVTALSCSLACTPLTNDLATEPKICSKDVIDLYSNCYTCTALSNALPKKIPQPTSTSTDVLAATAVQWWATTGADQFLVLSSAVAPVFNYPRALLGENQCTAAFVSPCVPTKAPEVTEITVDAGALATKSGNDWNIATPTGENGVEVKLIAKATGSGCTPNTPPVKGRWEVKVGDKVLADLAEDVWSPDWVADGDKFKTKTKSIFLFTSDGLDTKYTVTFVATNSVGSSAPSVVTLVQKTAAEPNTISTSGDGLCTKTQRIGFENSGTVLVKESPAGALVLDLAKTQEDQKRCTLIGVNDGRTIINSLTSIGCSQTSAARIAHCTILAPSIAAPIFAPECTDKSRTILQNVQLLNPTATFFGCVVLNNSIIGREASDGTLVKVNLNNNAFNTPLALSLDAASSAVLNGITVPTVYVSGEGTLYLYAGAYNGKLVVGQKVNVVLRESGINFAGGFEIVDPTVNLKIDSITDAFTLTCLPGWKIKGNFNANTNSLTKTVTLKNCNDAFSTAVRKFLTTAGIAECGQIVTSGCNGNTVPVRLALPGPIRQCFIVGDGLGNTDTTKCGTKTQTVGADISFRQVANQGVDNGALQLHKDAKMLFYNVAPDFGAYWTPGTPAIKNEFAAGATASTSRFEVILASSVDKGNVVNIPLVFCNGPTADITADSCCGPATPVLQRPTVEVINADGRLYNLLCAVGTQVTKELFPTIFKSGTAATAGSFGVIYLQLQPKSASTTVASGIVPQYTSASTYCVNLDQNPTVYTRDTFRADVLTTLSLQTEFFEVTSYDRSSDNQAFIKACFVCKDLSSAAQADARCVDIRNKILFDTALNAKTKARSDAGTELRNVNSGSGSNTALYGLFALALIPVLLFLAICIFLMNRTRKADNQYAQDTSTFSTVAAQPYPVYGKDLYPSTPIAYA